MPQWHRTAAWRLWRRPGSSYDASSSGSASLKIEVGHRDILALPGGSSGLASRREVEHGAEVTAQTEPPHGSGQGIRQQIGAGEPYAGNPVTYQDRSRRQIEPIE